MKFLKALWKALGDDRLGLMFAGFLFGMIFLDLSKGDHSAAVFDLVFAVVVGTLSWRDITKAMRS